MPGPARPGRTGSALTLYADLTRNVSNKMYLREIKFRLNRDATISRKCDIACFNQAAHTWHANSWILFRVQLGSIKCRLQKFLVASAMPMAQTAVRRLNRDNGEGLAFKLP
jgi:hypothetical protein